MNITSRTLIVNRIHRHRLLRPLEYLELIETIFPHVEDVPALMKAILDRGWLTPFQCEQLVDSYGAVVAGPYILLNRLGGGGGSQVFRARDSRSGQVVALKVMHETAMEHEEALIRFQREIDVALKLDHPNVIHAIDGHLSKSCGYLAMEYLSGVDLMNVILKQGKFPVAVACEYARQTAAGLQHIHEHGLIHRDIKPGNLLVTKGDPEAIIDATAVLRTSHGHQLKILDLGLVRTHQFSQAGALSITSMGSLLGTPDYMAPEQARDPKSVDIRADLYALGCTLYHFLAGRVPFHGGAMMQKLFRHQSETAVPVSKLQPDVPEPVSNLIQQMMAKSPNDRPVTPEVVAKALEPFAERNVD